MRSTILSPGTYTRRTGQLSTKHEEEQTQVFRREQQSTSNSEQRGIIRFKNAMNPYASALADVFGLEG